MIFNTSTPFIRINHPFNSEDISYPIIFNLRCNLVEENRGFFMSSSKERRSGIDRRQAPKIRYFPILDSKGRYIKRDRRSGLERRVNSHATHQFMPANEYLAPLAEFQD